MTTDNYIAHKREDGTEQPLQLLKEHLQGVAKLAGMFAEFFGAGQLAYFIGLYHDVGKYSKEFQDRIRGKKIKVDHSTAGAKLFWESKDVGAALCVAGHHGGIPNLGTKVDNPGDPTLLGRCKKSIPNFSAHKEDGLELLEKRPANFEGNAIEQALFVRMLFSSLVDADYLDTEAFMRGEDYRKVYFAKIDELWNRFERRLKDDGYFEPRHELNKRRTAILQRCIEMGKREKGLFTLTVPTGGGKTHSSMAFALNHAQENNLRRIIYVIPYLSIIDQSAKIFKDILGDENVVESHSGVSFDSDEEEVNYKRLAAENWEAPIIVTTAVQFLESLFANKPSQCRKLHNIANSVIIFDEAQMMPIKYLRPTLMAIEGLVKHFQCSVVMCSATQPKFQRFVQCGEGKRNLEKFLSLPFREIMEEDELTEMYSAFQRVKFEDDGILSYEEIANKMQEFEQVLCIAATKDEAQKIYEALDDDEVIYLSTNLCPVHRKEVIAEIRKRLKEGQGCRVVSTSVISVGVDIDFPVVFLERVGLDSLIQGAGRCNREGKKKPEDSIVYIFDTANWLESQFMGVEKSITRLFSKEYPEVDWGDPQAIEYYFNNLYNCKNLDSNIIELTGKCKFAEISKNYRIIEDNEYQIFIPFADEGREIENLLRSGNYTREIMRRANQYIVSVNEFIYRKLKEDGVIECLDGDLAVLLEPSQYDGTVGLVHQVEPRLITI